MHARTRSGAMAVTCIGTLCFAAPDCVGSALTDTEMALHARMHWRMDELTRCLSVLPARSAELLEMYAHFCEKYPVISIEDPFEQDDWSPCGELTAKNICQVVGDDILVTNPERVKRAIDEKACNALLLKVNQIGTITESIQAVKMSKEAGWGVMCSHR